ncbi:MAG: alpha/beta hydrolase [Chthoniobacterales bacterium]
MSDLNFLHRFVPGKPAETRVLLLLHGTGGDESDLLTLGRELDEAAALLSPRGQVSENGASRFFRRLAEGVFDQEEVVHRAHELADFVVAAATHYQFETRHLIAVGYSNGANIAAAMMMVRPEVLPAAILFRAMTVLANPPTADLRNRRILMSAGQLDPIIPLENSQRLAHLLKTSGARVTWKIQEAGHELVREDLVAAQQWLGA